MAKIKDKLYDATKKICHTIFLGKPNLFTTSDLNRQFRQIREELNGLHSLIGVRTNFYPSWVITGGSSDDITMDITCRTNDIFVRGVMFHPDTITETSVRFNIEDLQNAYILLRARKRVLTYSLDSSHDIAGATFEDNTSMPAANQEVYYDEKFVVTDNPNSVEDGYENICVLGYFFSVDVAGTVEVEYIKNTQSLAATDGAIAKVSTTLRVNRKIEYGNIDDGLSYNSAFNRLANKCLTIRNGEWFQPEAGDMSFQCNIRNGFLNVDVSKQTYTMDVRSTWFLRSGYLPNTLVKSVRNSLINRVLGSGIKEVFIPMSSVSVIPKDTNEKYAYGVGRFGLYCEDITSETSRITMVCRVDSITYLGTDKGYPTTFEIRSGELPIEERYLDGMTLCIPAFFYSLPL